MELNARYPNSKSGLCCFRFPLHSSEDFRLGDVWRRETQAGVAVKDTVTWMTSAPALPPPLKVEIGGAGVEKSNGWMGMGEREYMAVLTAPLSNTLLNTWEGFPNLGRPSSQPPDPHPPIISCSLSGS